MRQWRQRIRVMILPPNIFSTEVGLGPGGSSGGDGELDCFSFWQILVPVFSSSCSLEQGAESLRTYTRGRSQCRGLIPAVYLTQLATHLGRNTCRSLHREDTCMCKMVPMHSQARHAHYMSAAYRHTHLLHTCPQTCDKNTHEHTLVSTARGYTHNTYHSQVMVQVSITQISLTLSPSPHTHGTLLGTFPKCNAASAFPAKQHGGVGLSPRPGPPYRSSRYFRYSEQSCWVPGLNQGVQDAERKFSGEMAGR